jgi:uncharacterized membrane protein
MDDRRIEGIIGNLLRVGVLLAASIVFLGGALYLTQHAADRVSYAHFVAGGDTVRSIGGVFMAAVRLNSEGLIQFGLLLLIATPIARVAFAVVGFALEKDRLYVVVSLIVLAILAFSLLHAI